MVETLSQPGAQPDLLLLAPALPSPTDRGDLRRWYHMLRLLARQHRVHLGCFADPGHERDHLGRIKALCHETCFVAPPPVRPVRALRALARGKPLSVPRGRDEVLAAWVARLLRRHPVGAAIACSGYMAAYLLGASHCTRVLDFGDLDLDWRRHAAVRQPWPVEAQSQQGAAREVLRECPAADQFDHLVFASAIQARRYAQLTPHAADKVHTIINGVDADWFSPHASYPDPFAPGGRALVMAGAMDDAANAAAAAWFVRHVFVPLRAHDPALRFYVVGARPLPRVRALTLAAGVVVTGAVPDVRPYLSHAAVVVAPQQAVHPAQNQMLEAMAMQKPVVAGPEVLAGLSLRPGIELLLAGGAGQFIIQVRKALDDGALYAQVAQAARECVLRHHAWQTTLSPLDTLLASAARARSAG
jgi:sugar transferase (PEP-CTERM/EpsH1 system associated)